MNAMFDIAIVGSGPGGYVAAIRAAQLGFKTAVVEENRLAGVCLNWGCIPTKALLRSAEVYRSILHAENFGLEVGQVGFDLAAIVKRSRGVSTRLSGGIASPLKKNKVKVIDGRAHIAAPGGVRVTRAERRSGTLPSC
jgi:dihydrolipoamide dehydrogenase